MRHLPLAGIALLIAIAFGLRPLVQLVRYGRSGILLFQSGRPAQHLRDGLLVTLFALLLVQAVVALRPGSVDLLVDEHGALRGALQAAGAALMLGGIGLLAAAQLNMGASWRIGIEEGARPGLVTEGLYRYSRNPIYVGLLLAIAGYTALLPTVLSLILLAGSYVGVRSQIAAEEAYLAATYGDAFADYAPRVGRLLPGIGRLRHTPARERATPPRPGSHG